MVSVVVCLDREEIGSQLDVESAIPRPMSSTVNQVALQINGPVHAIIRMRDLISWLEEHGHTRDLEGMKAYRQKYGSGDQ